MKKFFAIYLTTAMAALAALTACSDADEAPARQGMGMVEVRLTAPYQMATRATGDRLDPTADVEKIHNYMVAFVDADGKVADRVTGNAQGAEEDTFRFLLAPGTYTVYGFANFDYDALGIVKGSDMPDLSDAVIVTTNGWTQNIPMTSHVGGQEVTVVEAENQSFEVELVRTMAKLQLDFDNQSQQPIKLLGYEIYPLTTDTVPLFEPDDIRAITYQGDTLKVHYKDTTAYTVTFAASDVVNLAAKDEEGHTHTIYVYVNETNATATSTRNQYSIRLRTQRTNNVGDEVVDYRYGFTVNRAAEVTEEGKTGFDYIHRNDWIRLPLTFTDWSFRVEALPFPPIAGFQSRVETADALSITFSTGGYIFLQPMFRNNVEDTEGVWRKFSDAAVEFVLPGTYTASDNRVESIDPTTGTGIIITGNLSVFEPSESTGEREYFQQLSSGEIVGKLDNLFSGEGQVTITLLINLEGFAYQFNYNIILKN
ncbi:MAG: FimB/Mfa2 family fimbrial subunit [Prevotella sp.]|nr:FimB/Mfa2 family fimbrial subunit [Prevotella sp.]